MNYTLERFINDDKNIQEFDKIYNYNKDDGKILIKKFRATKLKSSTSLSSNDDNGKFGVEIINIPRYYTVYLGLYLTNNEVNKFKFYIKIFDTYGKEVDNIETNNLLNLKGINVKIYLPNYSNDDHVGLFLNSNQESKFKNKLTYNNNLECYEINYKDKIGEFEVKGYKSNEPTILSKAQSYKDSQNKSNEPTIISKAQSYKDSQNKSNEPTILSKAQSYKDSQNKSNEPTILSKAQSYKDSQDKSIDTKDTEPLDILWIIVLSIIGGIFLIFVVYIIYYFFIKKGPCRKVDYMVLDNLGANAIPYGTTKMMSAMTPRYSPRFLRG